MSGSDSRRYRASLASKAEMLRGLMGEELWEQGRWMDWRWRCCEVMVCPDLGQILVCSDYADGSKFDWADPDLAEKLRADVEGRL